MGKYVDGFVLVVAKDYEKEYLKMAEEGKEVWRGIVAGFRSDWFQGAEHLLKCYCEQVVIERQIADMLHTFSIHSPRYWSWCGYMFLSSAAW